MKRTDPLEFGDGSVGAVGALGAILGVVLSVLVGPDGDPLLWASVGGVVGLAVGLLAAELQ